MNISNNYADLYIFTLKLLLQVEYLDEEEITIYLPKIRCDDEYYLIALSIENFRTLSKEDREKLTNFYFETKDIKDFNTKEYMDLLVKTNIVEKVKITPKNKDKKLPAIKINENFNGNLKNVLKEIL